MSSSSSLGGSGYFGYGCSAPADSGLDGGGLWTRTFLTGLGFANVTAGGGASVFAEPSEVRARANEEEEGGWALVEGAVVGEAASLVIVIGVLPLVLRRKGLWEPKLEEDSEAMLGALCGVVVLVLKLEGSAGT